MRTQLQKLLFNLRQLRWRLGELRADVEYAATGNVIYYAADFSELYAYLHYDGDVTNIGVGIYSADEAKASHQHRLGLAHLFHTLAPTIYLLPPYTIEMWSYVRAQSGSEHRVSDLHNLAEQALRGLDAPTLGLLESLNSKSELTADEAERLLGLIKDDFERLCVDVRAFVTWNRRGDALKMLLNEREISYDANEILREQGLNPEEFSEPTISEELKVFESFSEEMKSDKRYAKLVDARALVFLRDLNKLIEPSGAKLVLVTRDSSMRETVGRLQHQRWFGWPSAADHLRGIETIFLDLLLRGIPQLKMKLAWIRDSDLKLESMEAAVSDIIRRMDANSDRRTNIYDLGHAGQSVLESRSKLWDAHINLQLSLALSATPWLKDKFLRVFSKPSGEHWPASKDLLRGQSHTIELLRNLWEFVSTPKYKHLATEDAENVWSELHNESLRMIFLGHLGVEGVEKIRAILSEQTKDSGGESKTTLLSVSALRMPSIEFVSEAYQNRLKMLESYVQDADRSPTWAKKQFFPIVFEATSGISEPEDFLFMAFVLGMMELWREAISMAERSLQISSHSRFNPSEVYYFISFAKRTQGKTMSDPAAEARAYIEANGFILRAMRERPDDPRYLKEQAAIGLLYWEADRVIERSGVTAGNGAAREGKPLPVDLQGAKGLLLKALDIELERQGQGNDNRLVVDILNILAYAEALSDSPDFESAEKYLEQIEVEFDRAKNQRLMILEGVRPRIEDTKIVVAARHAFVDGKLDELESCLEELHNMLLKYYLSEAQQKVYKEHESLFMTWIQELRDRLQS